MKLLNIGSGPHYAEGWVNLDLNTHEDWAKQADVIASVYDMPFENEEFDRVYMGHLLEHLVYDKIPEAIAEVRRVSKPGSEIMVVGPCLELAKKTNQPTWLLKDIEAHGDTNSGFGHAWTPTESLTVDILKRSGLNNVKAVSISTVTKPRWPNPTTAPWQCAVQAFV